MQTEIPNKILTAFRNWKRFLALYGGRGGAKTESAGRVFVKEASENRHKILCGREYQTNIADSIHSTLVDLIEELKVPGYKITDKSIRHLKTGSEFIFKGLKKETVGSLKSIKGITLAWIEEAQYVSAKSLRILTPSVRAKNSKILFTFNVEEETDPVYEKFVLTKRDDTVVCKVNYYDNPFFDEPLKSDMLWDKEHDYETYLHVWEGEPIRYSEDQVYNDKWEILDFDTPDNVKFYHGIDFGFSNDELAGWRGYVQDDCLYIDYEAYKKGVELDDIAGYLEECIPTIKTWESIADSSRPETISHLKNKFGFNIIPSKKGKGSVEDGIVKVRKFKKIYVHPRCKNTIFELRHYKWKKDPKTDQNTRIPQDRYNHLMDAMRYGLEKYGHNTMRLIRY